MSDIIWETFDGLFKTLHRQGRRVEELEARVTELERKVAERKEAISRTTESDEQELKNESNGT